MRMENDECFRSEEDGNKWNVSERGMSSKKVTKKRERERNNTTNQEDVRLEPIEKRGEK